MEKGAGPRHDPTHTCLGVRAQGKGRRWREGGEGQEMVMGVVPGRTVRVTPWRSYVRGP